MAWVRFQTHLKISLYILFYYIFEKSLDLDDFKGKYCDSGPYPLMHTIIDAINNGTNTTCTNTQTTKTTIATTQTSTTTTITTTTTVNTVTELLKETTPVTEETVCNNETELLSDFDDCTSFHVCLSGIEKPIAKLKCPESMWFDLVVNTCVYTMPVRVIKQSHIE